MLISSWTAKSRPDSRVYSTKLKNRIRAQCPGMSEHKDILLVINKDIRYALNKAYENNYDD